VAGPLSRSTGSLVVLGDDALGEGLFDRSGVDSCMVGVVQRRHIRKSMMRVGFVCTILLLWGGCVGEGAGASFFRASGLRFR